MASDLMKSKHAPKQREGGKDGKKGGGGGGGGKDRGGGRGAIKKVIMIWPTFALLNLRI